MWPKSKRKYGVGKFLIVFFILFSLINEIMCDLNYRISKDLKIFTDQSTHDHGKVYRVFCQTENSTPRNKNESNGQNPEKTFSCQLAKSAEKENLDVDERTFRFGHRIIGQRKRLQFALLPIMYKMGVMTTLLTGLTVLAFKGLTIGVILLIFAFGNHFLKYHKHGPELPQPIHVHVHSQDGGVKYHNYETEFVPGLSSRIDTNQQYVKTYIQNNRENRARFFLNQNNKIKFL